MTLCKCTHFYFIVLHCSLFSFSIALSLATFHSTFYSMYIATSIGGFVALSTMIVIVMLYIPSYIITTLKFRSGFLPSLRDDNFPDFRQAADNVTVLLGSVFWGMLATGAFFFFIIAIPIVLIADPKTQHSALLFLTRIAGTSCFLICCFRDALGYVLYSSIFLLVLSPLGVFASLLIKVLLLCAVRRKYLGGFYRQVFLRRKENAQIFIFMTLP